MTSTFHKSQDIILPSFCSSLANNKGQELNLLDVRRCLLQYLEVTNEFRASDDLFVLYAGKQKGKQPLARWIKSAILECYEVMEVTLPKALRAH